VRTTLPLGNSQKKKEISNSAIRKFSKKKEVQTLPSEEFFFVLVKGNRQMGFQANPTKDRIYRIARSGSQNN
jgi:hypothetical protein